MTIGALSKELGISKTGITKYLKASGLFSELEKSGNKYLVPEEIANRVREHFRQPTADNSQTANQELAFLLDQIRIKDEQIAVLQQALTQEQQLHAADKQQLLLLESEHRPRRPSVFRFFRGLHKNNN